MPLSTCVFLLLALTASAQAPARETAFVYTVHADLEIGYSQAFYPPSVDTLYLRADRANAIVPRRTDIYFWPITNEFRADWNARDERPAGVLEIIQGGRLIKTAQLTEFVTLYDSRQPSETRRLAEGAEAHAAVQEYAEARAKWFEAMQRYGEEQRTYDERMRAAIRDAATGKAPVVPETPVAPADFTLIIGELQRGFVVNLPAGRYQVQFRGEDGQVVSGTRRDVIAFGPRREAVTYRVIPQSRWTVPERSTEAGDIVYLARPTTLYFQPMHSLEFNEADYTRADTPQDRQASADRWLWVEVEKVSDVQLHASSGGGREDVAHSRPYYVQQLGGTLGYEVLEWEAGRFGDEGPSFEAYAVPETKTDDELHIWLADAKGNVLPMSGRAIRFVRTQFDATSYLLPLLPVAAGAVLFGRRWGRRKKGE